MKRKQKAKSSPLRTLALYGMLGALGLGAYMLNKTHSQKEEPILEVPEETTSKNKNRLDSILAETPYFEQLKSDGAIQGILYNPSDKQVRKYTEKTLEGRASNRESLLEENESTYDKIKVTDTYFTPVLTIEFGKKNPRYLVINDGILEGKNDREIRSLLINQLSKIKSCYYGFQKDGLKITAENIDSKKCSVGFAKEISVINAYHEELKEHIRDIANARDSFISYQHIGNILANYKNQKRKLENLNNQFEKDFSKEIQKEFEKEIRINEGENEIQFNIDGKKGLFHPR